MIRCPRIKWDALLLPDIIDAIFIFKKEKICIRQEGKVKDIHDTALYQTIWKHESMFRLMVAGAITILQYLRFLKNFRVKIYSSYLCRLKIKVLSYQVQLSYAICLM